MLLGFSGGVKIRTVVSQGCRPIGEPFTITGTEGNLVTSLSAKSAYEQLQTTFDALPEADRALARGNLMVGIALSEYVDEFKTGDFLIRNLLGGDPERGALLLAARPRVGQTLQFHLRDKQVAHEQLVALTSTSSLQPPIASLLFPCNGRGSDLFGASGHDAQLIQAAWGQHPSAGVFCNGEIGPSGGQNFIHGYTACVATFS
jgi:small ligand-binding sensory domain FIST